MPEPARLRNAGLTILLPLALLATKTDCDDSDESSTAVCSPLARVGCTVLRRRNALNAVCACCAALLLLLLLLLWLFDDDDDDTGGGIVGCCCCCDANGGALTFDDDDELIAESSL